MAALITRLVIAINFHRIKRFAHFLLGWSSRSTYFCECSPKADIEIKKMRGDSDSHTWLLSIADLTPGCKDLVARSSWQNNAQVQVYKVVEQAGFTIEKGEVRSFFQLAHSRVLSTVPLEDGFNEVKNPTTPYRNRRASMERLYDVLIHGKTLGVKHRYTPMQPSHLGDRDQKLANAAYKMKYKDGPKALFEVTSFKAATPWWSSTAQNWPQGFCDMPMIREARLKNRGDMLQYRWQAEIIAGCEDMLIREAGKPQWMLPLGCVHDSTLVVWPMLSNPVLGHAGSRFYRFAQQVNELDPRSLFPAVLDYKEWTGLEIVWRSPYTLKKEFGANFSFGGYSKTSQILPFMVGEEEMAFKICAKKCFGKTKKEMVATVSETPWHSV